MKKLILVLSIALSASLMAQSDANSPAKAGAKPEEIQLNQLVTLPPPEKTGGKPLMEVIATRKSSRDFNVTGKLSAQEISNLLWCANGFRDEKMRTAPSAVNAQAVDIYVFMSNGIWLYEPKEHALRLFKKGDFRKHTGKQPFVTKAAINLVFVYDKTRWPRPGKNDGRWALADAAYCSENVYLYCASAGLKTVVRGMFDERALRVLLKLTPEQIPVLTQSVGR